MIILNITPADHCRQLESFLRNHLPLAPQAFLKKVVKSGNVTVNEEEVTSFHVLHLGDRVALKETGRIKELYTDCPPSLDILYEDDRIVMFNKAAGIPVHKAAEDRGENLVEVAERFLAIREKMRSSANVKIKLRPVNRLDRGTSGGVILAKSSVAAGMFGRLVREGGLGKLYLAVVEGIIHPEGTIDAPLDGKESQTVYRVIFQGKNAAFLAVRPITGRMHQIRQHLELVGHPVIGDHRYGGRRNEDMAGHALHSFKTAIVHPETSKEMEIIAPLPDELLRLIEKVTKDAYADILKALPETEV